MFFQRVKYQVVRCLRNKDNIFWLLCFPIILGTLFYFGFGQTQEDTELAKDIPIAIVKEDSYDTEFEAIIKELSEGKDKMFTLKIQDEEKAKKLLNEDEIIGYYKLSKDSDNKLVVLENGISQSIMEMVLSQYNRTKIVVTDLVSKEKDMSAIPAKAQSIVEAINSDKEYTRVVDEDVQKTNNVLIYFYALISMICMYGSIWGIDIVKTLEANMTTLGARRNVAPTGKFVMLASDVIGTWIIHILEIVVILVYLINVLGVDFGTHYMLVFFGCLMGSMTGISMGVLIGVLVRGRNRIKDAVGMAVSMTFCFCAGLMVGDMPRIIENHFPIFNRINPAMLVSNCFYSLNIYKDYSAYIQNMVSLFGITVLFLVIGCLLLRRRKYASI